MKPNTKIFPNVAAHSYIMNKTRDEMPNHNNRTMESDYEYNITKPRWLIKFTGKYEVFVIFEVVDFLLYFEGDINLDKKNIVLFPVLFEWFVLIP